MHVGVDLRRGSGGVRGEEVDDDVPRDEGLDGDHDCLDYFQRKEMRAAGVAMGGDVLRACDAMLDLLQIGAQQVDQETHQVLELCPRGNNKDVIIIILVHDNVYTPC
jgi:hypothetical protein